MAKEMSEKVDEGLDYLKLGSKFSFITMILILVLIFALFEGFWLGYSFVFFVWIPFLTLFTWEYGLYKRYKGWFLVNQKRIALTLAIGAVILFASFLPSLLPWGNGFVTEWIPPLAWAFYTLSEGYGFRMLKRDYGLNFKSSFICSLVGVLIFCLTYTILQLKAYFSFIPVILSPSSIQPLAVAFIFASPMLMASSLLAIKEIGKKRGAPAYVIRDTILKIRKLPNFLRKSARKNLIIFFIVLFLVYLTVFSMATTAIAFEYFGSMDFEFAGGYVSEENWGLQFLENFSKIFGEPLTILLAKLSIVLTLGPFLSFLTIPIYWAIGFLIICFIANHKRVERLSDLQSES